MITPKITIGRDVIPVRPDEQHVYLVETALVAKGYGVAPNVIRNHKDRNRDELVEGKHWIACATKSDAGTPPIKRTFWTRNGVVRLGFFIRSERAKKFRDLAEDLIVDAGKKASSQMPTNLADCYLEIGALLKKGEALDKAIDLIRPRHEYGAPSSVNGKPRTRLIPAYFRSLPPDHMTKLYVEIEGQLYLQLSTQN